MYSIQIFKINIWLEFKFVLKYEREVHSSARVILMENKLVQEQLLPQRLKSKIFEKISLLQISNLIFFLFFSKIDFSLKAFRQTAEQFPLAGFFLILDHCDRR